METKKVCKMIERGDYRIYVEPMIYDKEKFVISIRNIKLNCTEVYKDNLTTEGVDEILSSKEFSRKITKIKKDTLDIYSSSKVYNLVVFVNEKSVELSVSLNYNANSDTEELDWDYLDDVDLTDDESDGLDDYVTSYEWLKQTINKSKRDSQ